MGRQKLVGNARQLSLAPLYPTYGWEVAPFANLSPDIGEVSLH